jgi:hypothetical protein
MKLNDFCIGAVNVGCTGIVFVMLGWLIYIFGGWIVEDIREKKLAKEEEP